VSGADVRAVEAALRDLTLPAAEIDRDRLMFEAGQAAAPRPWGWLLATAISTTVAVGLGLALLSRAAPTPARRYLEVPTNQEPKPGLPPQVQDDQANGPGVVPGSEGPADAPPANSAALSDGFSRPRYYQLQDQVLRWGLDGLPATPPTTPPPAEKREMLGRSP
jgi:hypothetical protein